MVARPGLGSQKGMGITTGYGRRSGIYCRKVELTNQQHTIPMNHRKTSIGEIAAWSIASAVIVTLLIYVTTQGLILGAKAIAYAAGTVADRNAESECIQWAAEAKRHTPYSEANPGGYFLTKWQDEECRSIGIHINAPVL